MVGVGTRQPQWTYLDLIQGRANPDVGKLLDDQRPLAQDANC